MTELNTIVVNNSRKYRVPYAGLGITISYDMENRSDNCSECHAGPGRYHVYGCSQELCPYCRNFLFQCPCKKNGLVEQ